MKTIGIRELKAGLSQALREVAAGEVMLITDRGRVVAELRSPLTSGRVVSPQERALARLAGAGNLRVAERPRHLYRPSPIKSAKGLARRLIDEDRGE
jgi:antitoxin (DNA-binding transcriptional repressor) of toxin-antitoxin stability system